MLLPPLYPPKPTRTWAHTEHHERLIQDDAYIVEPKANGDRCLVFVLPEGVQLWNRHGRQTAQTWLGELRAELSAWRLPIGTILDCELLHEPKPSQDLLVFDLASECDNPLFARRDSLRHLFGRSPGRHIKLAPWLPKATAYEDALAAGHEGVVFKCLDSLYEWQRGPQNTEVSSWFKIKPVHAYK